MRPIATTPKVVCLGPIDGKGQREVRAVVDNRRELPDELPAGFITLPLLVGAEIPEKSEVYTVAGGYFKDSDRADQEEARRRFSRLFAAWKRLQDLEDFQRDYPKIDMAREVADAEQTLSQEEALIPASLRNDPPGGGGQ